MAELGLDCLRYLFDVHRRALFIKNGLDHLSLRQLALWDRRQLVFIICKQASRYAQSLDFFLESSQLRFFLSQDFKNILHENHDYNGLLQALSNTTQCIICSRHNSLRIFQKPAQKSHCTHSARAFNLVLVGALMKDNSRPPESQAERADRLAFDVLDAEIPTLIAEFAGTSLDYDPVLEAAALEAIAHEDNSSD